MSEQRVTSLSRNTGAAALQGTCNRQVTGGTGDCLGNSCPRGLQGQTVYGGSRGGEALLEKKQLLT